jgi:hypothetical protein
VSVRLVPAAAGRPAFIEVLIGSRLLIHLVTMPAEPAAPGWLEQLATDSRATRDRHGYNRLRLVLAAPAGEQTAGFVDLATRFARATAGDERAHLHLLAQTQLPAELSPAPVPAATAAGAAVTVAK